MPSALRVSKAYSISFSVTSTFIIDSGAKTPKRPGWSWRILAAKSWHSRTVLAASSAPASNQRPGVEASDITAVRTPSLSISSISLAGVQSTIGLNAGMLRLPSHSNCLAR